jgi:hypothetical protein
MARSQLKALFEEKVEDDVVLEVGEESMESAMLDIQESYVEVESLEQDQEELEEIAEGLESVIESMEATMEQGGLDPIAAQFAHHAVDAYTARLGFESASLLPALEAFGGDSGREASTTVSMESIGEQLRKIWEAIKSVVNKAMTAVKNFFKKIFDAIPKFEKRLKAIGQDLSRKSNWTVKGDGKFKAPAASIVQYDNKVTPAAVNKGLSNLRSAIEVAYTDAASEAAKYYADVASIFNTHKSADDEEEATKALQKRAKAGNVVVDAYKKIEKTLFSGDRALSEAERTKGPKGDDQEKTVSFSIEKKSGYKDVSADTQIEVPSIAELRSMTDELNRLVETIKKKQSNIDAIHTKRDEAMKQGENVVKGSSIGKMWATAKGKKVLKSAEADMVKPITLLTNYSMGVTRGGISYVESALSQYAEPGSSKKDDKSDD